MDLLMANKSLVMALYIWPYKSLGCGKSNKICCVFSSRLLFHKHLNSSEKTLMITNKLKEKQHKSFKLYVSPVSLLYGIVSTSIINWIRGKKCIFFIRERKEKRKKESGKSMSW